MFVVFFLLKKFKFILDQRKKNRIFEQSFERELKYLIRLP